jgi:hypothetical protein
LKSKLVPITLALPPALGRSPGIHVSSLIRAIALETGILDAKWAEDLSLVDVREITDPTSILRISIGLAWEEWYLKQLPGVVKHPGEMRVEGIYMTHDGESLEVIVTFRGRRYALALHEVKATYKSIKTVAPRLITDDPQDPEDLETQWMWISQCQAYCQALDTLIAYLHVLFLCGDYTFPITPQLLCWRIEFTPEEVESKWSLIRDYRDYRLTLDGGGIEP